MRVVAVDIDDVLFPLVPHLTAFVNARLATNIRLDQYSTYDFSRVWNISRDEAVDLAELYLDVHPLDLAPLQSAADAVARLRSGYRLVVVTSREERFRAKTEAWLDRHFPGSFDEVAMTGNHYRGNGCLSKGDVCRDMGVEYLIDDHPRHLSSARSRGVRGILFGDYPWQREYPAQGRRRVPSWPMMPAALGIGQPVAS